MSPILSHRKDERYIFLKKFIGVQHLQCCITFRCTAKWISYMYTYIHSFFFRFFSHIGHYRVLNRIPSAIQHVLISCLFYIYWCIYISPNLPVYPCLPSPNNYVCFLHAWLYFCFVNKFICIFFLDSTYINIIWYLSFCVWLTSLSMTMSRFIHVATNGIISFFLWLSNIPLYICTTSSISIQLLISI